MHDDLVVLRTQVGMLRVDELVQMSLCLCLELLDQSLLLLLVLFIPEAFDVRRPFPSLGNRVSAMSPAKPLDLTVFFARHIGEEFAALADLLDGLIEGDRRSICSRPACPPA